MNDRSPRFSLIVTTKDRTTELAKMLDSIGSQTFTDYELIVVDQNSDDRLLPILEHCVGREKISRLVCEVGASKGRNTGLRHAKGEILAFPDDDCWYPVQTLENVDGWFKVNSGYDILSLTSRDETGRLSGNRWRSELCDLSVTNIFRTTACYCFFVKGTEKARRVTFDEDLGPGSGTPFGASDDTDYILTGMKAGLKGRFVKRWYIGHPTKDARSGTITVSRSYAYGSGMGRVQGKHKLFFLWIAFVAYDMARAFIMTLRGRRVPASLWYAHGKGLVHGYLAG